MDADSDFFLNADEHNEKKAKEWNCIKATWKR